MAGAKSDGAAMPRLEFTRDGRVSGFTGCNLLSGSYRLEEDRLEVVAATTKRACLGAGGESEEKLLAVLGDRPRVRTEARRLVLTGTKGGTVVLEPAP
jgi:heat shock protein HslJ